MAADKHSDLPASDRHLGWAISAVLTGAMVTHERWGRGVYWALGNDGTVKALDESGDGLERSVDLNVFKAWTGFFIYEPEPDDAPEPTYGERIVALEAECRALRELVKGEFSALSARITEVSRMTRSVAPVATGTIGGVDLSKLR